MGECRKSPKSRLNVYITTKMEKQKSHAQKIIELEIKSKKTSTDLVFTYTDDGYNNCDGSYYDTDD